MEDDVVVGIVGFVMVVVPVVGCGVYFDVACPMSCSDDDLCVEKVGASVGVELSLVDDFNVFSGVGGCDSWEE